VNEGKSVTIPMQREHHSEDHEMISLEGNGSRLHEQVYPLSPLIPHILNSQYNQPE